MVTSYLIGLTLLGTVAWMVASLCRCRHRELRREFRAPDGSPLAVGSRQRQVLHFVCDCGYAVPAISRTAGEATQARRLRKQTAHQPAKAKRPSNVSGSPAGVVDIQKRRAAR